MRVEDLHKPCIPVAYAALIVDVAANSGVGRQALLAGLNIPPKLFDMADARLSLLQGNALLYRALKLSGNGALGYDIGLHSHLTSHGFMGYGVMSYPTLRAAAEFGAKFIQIRLPPLRMSVFEDGEQGVIEAAETLHLGAVRQCMFDLFLVGLYRMAPIITGGDLDLTGVELWFDYPEPAYYARYRERLPPVRFSMGANQMRFPVEFLDRPLVTANPQTAQLVTQQCERELTLLGFTEDFPARVRTLLTSNEHGDYPDQERVAARLSISARTLKRRLQEHGLSFQALLDEARRRDSIRLLEDPTLSVEAIALRVGYTDPANFTRAFRKWTGATPSGFRERLLRAVSGAKRNNSEGS